MIPIYQSTGEAASKVIKLLPVVPLQPEKTGLIELLGAKGRRRVSSTLC